MGALKSGRRPGHSIDLSNRGKKGRHNAEHSSYKEYSSGSCDGWDRHDCWSRDRAEDQCRLQTTNNAVRDRTRDWFGVEGTLDVDGEQVKLAVLLDAARSGARGVEVRNGYFSTVFVTVVGTISSVCVM